MPGTGGIIANGLTIGLPGKPNGATGCQGPTILRRLISRAAVDTTKKPSTANVQTIIRTTSTA